MIQFSVIHRERIDCCYLFRRLFFFVSVHCLLPYVGGWMFLYMVKGCGGSGVGYGFVIVAHNNDSLLLFRNILVDIL